MIQKLYEFSCFRKVIKNNRTSGNSLLFTNKDEAIKAFKIKVNEFRNEFYNECISIHECIGDDPCDFEEHGEFITFELITDDLIINLNVNEIYCHETVEDTKTHSTLFTKEL